MEQSQLEVIDALVGRMVRHCADACWAVGNKGSATWRSPGRRRRLGPVPGSRAFPLFVEITALATFLCGEILGDSDPVRGPGWRDHLLDRTSEVASDPSGDLATHLQRLVDDWPRTHDRLWWHDVLTLRVDVYHDTRRDDEGSLNATAESTIGASLTAAGWPLPDVAGVREVTNMCASLAAGSRKDCFEVRAVLLGSSSP